MKADFSPKSIHLQKSLKNLKKTKLFFTVFSLNYYETPLDTFLTLPAFDYSKHLFY
jgi:hypothetical protein